MNPETFRKKKTAVDVALDSCGIGHNAQEELSNTLEQITDFCANLQKRASAQAIHDLFVNKPVGLSVTADHALRGGIVSAIGALVNWDVSEALSYAADIAEDVNAHKEAEAIRDMAFREVAA